IHLPTCAPENMKMSDVTAYTPATSTFGNVALVRFSSAVSDPYTQFRFVTVFCSTDWTLLEYCPNAGVVVVPPPPSSVSRSAQVADPLPPAWLESPWRCV